jgi:hypothetical protein
MAAPPYYKKVKLAALDIIQNDLAGVALEYLVIDPYPPLRRQFCRLFPQLFKKTSGPLFCYAWGGVRQRFFHCEDIKRRIAI